MNKHLIEHRNRIDYYERYVLILPDIAAGHKGRYTVYLMPTTTAKSVRVVGRELPLGVARKVAAKWIAKYKETAEKTNSKFTKMRKSGELP